MKKRMGMAMIRNKYPTLTEAERKIADYILANAEKVPGMTIHQLAKEVGVAGSAIVRLGKTLGFKGYADLKMSLVMEIFSEPEILSDIAKTDNVGDIFQKVFASNVKALHDTSQMMDFDAIGRAIQMIRDADNIFIFGVGTSSTVAQDGQYRLMQLGYRVQCASDGLYMRMTASGLTANDLAIGISHCGETRDTIDMLKISKTRGAACIAITSHKDSQICKIADVSLVAYSDAPRYGYGGAIVPARIAHICLIDALSVALAYQDYNRSLEKIEQRNEILTSLRI